MISMLEENMPEASDLPEKVPRWMSRVQGKLVEGFCDRMEG